MAGSLEALDVYWHIASGQPFWSLYNRGVRFTYWDGRKLRIVSKVKIPFEWVARAGWRFDGMSREQIETVAVAELKGRKAAGIASDMLDLGTSLSIPILHYPAILEGLRKRTILGVRP